MTWSPEATVRPNSPVREGVNPSQRRGAADVALEADLEEDESAGRDRGDADRGPGPGDVGGRDIKVTAGRKLPTRLEAGAEVKTVESPKAVGDEPSPGPGPGPMIEAGRNVAVTRLLSLLCSRRYQVK